MELLYGMDPLCGWCFGISPALRKVMADHPRLTVTPVLAGLVTGDGVGPYAQKEGYIRSASARLQAVTGQSPAPAFYDLIRRPGVKGDSAPPTVVIGAVRKMSRDRVADFALRVTEAHFAQGADLNDLETYRAILWDMGLPPIDLCPRDLSRHDLAQTEWAQGRALGLTSFPTLWLRHGGKTRPVALTYAPDALSNTVKTMTRDI